MEHTKDSFITSFFKLESAGGIMLILAAILAMLCANSILAPTYQLIMTTPVGVHAGTFEINKPLLLWINDGLMAIFFLLVGLELKRELVEGELSDKRNIILPGAGAVGGMLVPALFYVYFNYDDPIAIKGWAIPAATDIAFALGVLTLLGNRVPKSLKVFLVALAIFDDIGAILIIAFFYTSKISYTALLVVAVSALILGALNYRNVVSKSPYIVIGIIMWAAMLKSGVHATLAGVILALFIPMYSKKDPKHSPVKTLEHDLHSAVAFFVLPVFAFANAGINLKGVGMNEILHDVPLGIASGLFLGKQIGIVLCCWVVVKLGMTKLPDDMSWTKLYGTAALCGIGFTMSLFIGSLAFEETGVNQLFDERLGIILGSLLSGLLGYLVLSLSLKKKPS